MKSFNRYIAVFLALLMIAALSVSVSADGSDALLFDDADFLSSGEEKKIAEEMKRIEDEYGICIIIYFTRNKYPSDVDEEDLMDMMDRDARKLIYDHKTKEDAVLFYMSLDGGYRDYYFYRLGRCFDAIEYGREEELLKKRAEKYLTQNDFYGAATEFLSFTDEAMLALSNGGSVVKKTDVLAEYLPVILLVSAVIALVSVLIMKSQMKSVAFKNEAHMYAAKDSFNVRSAADIFLYRTVSRMRKPDNNSGGGSRGGGSRGGGGGGRC